MLYLLDIFFLAFHSGWMLFNLFGWAHPRTRPWNLYTLLLTALSWVGMGYFYGWGYCVCTDWHWQVLRKLGEEELPASYLTYLAQRLFGVTPERIWVDSLALAGLIVPLGLNLYLRYRKKGGKKKEMS